MPPVVKWAEPFLSTSYISSVYLFVTYGTSIEAWRDVVVFNPDNRVRQTGRGSGVNQGWALNSFRALNWAVPMTQFGIPAGPSGFGVAFAYNRIGSAAATTIGNFAESDGIVNHVHIELNAAGQLVVYRGYGSTKVQLGISDGTVGNSGPGTIPFAAALSGLSHYEIRPVISSTVGQVLVKADSQLIMNLTNVNTKNGGSGNVGIHGFETAPADITDYILHDGSDWLGDMRAGYFETSVNGTFSAGTPVGAPTLHEALDEIQYNADTDYVLIDSTSLPKGVSTQTRALPANAGTIAAVMPWQIARKDDAGICVVRGGLVSGGVVGDGGRDIAMPSGYRPLYTTPQMIDPNTGLPWTVVAASAAEPYCERVA